MRAALYTRISMDRSGKRAGVERQLGDGQSLCADRGWTIVGTYEDNDRSAYSGRERPAYEELVGEVAAGNIDVVVAWHSDRLWRNVLEQQTFLAVGKDAGLKLVATPGADFDPNDADDAFMSTLLTAMAQKESGDKSRRMKRKQREKAERGEFHGGGPGFGYRISSPGQLEIIPEQAELIREATLRLLAGETTRSIVLDWDRRGIRTATGKGVWRVDTLAKLVQTPRIAGVRMVDGEEVIGTWEPIIDRKTRDRIIALFDARRRGPRERTKKHLLSGLLRCGKCGAPMTVSTVRQVLRYRCQPKGMGGCGGVSVVAALADETAVGMVLGHLDSDAFTKALGRARRSAAKVDRVVDDALEQLKTDRARLVELGDWLGDGRIDLDTFKRQTSRLQERIEDNERTVAKSQSATPAARYEGQGEMLRTAWEHMTLEERRLVLTTLVERFRVDPSTTPRYDPNRIVPEWRFR